MSGRRETPDVLAALLEGRQFASMSQPERLALIVPEEFTKDEWVAFGAKIRRADARIRFVIGDWLLAGNRQWGDMYGEAERITGKSNQYLRDCAYVARAFELSSRDDNLSWTHHKVIAGAQEERRAELLRIAAEERLSVNALRALTRPQREPQTLERASAHSEAASSGTMGERRIYDAGSDGGMAENSEVAQPIQSGPPAGLGEESGQISTAAARPGIAGPVSGKLSPNSGEGTTVLVEMPLATAAVLHAWLLDDVDGLPGLSAEDIGAIRAGLRAALGDGSGDVIGVVEEVES